MKVIFCMTTKRKKVRNIPKKKLQGFTKTSQLASYTST